MIYCIYKATNILNNKVYIGYTNNLESRINEHRVACNHYNFTFYKSIKKYGWVNFKWEIIYQSKDKDYCKNVMEKYFINEYRSYIGFIDTNGYNMTLGGEGNSGQKTKEHIEKISNSNTGKKRSDKIRKKFSAMNAKTWKLVNMDGLEVIITNLFVFCKENNLSASAMSKLSKLKTSHHKEWVYAQRI